jgi:predicted metal-dependent phosphoesterase TrpH
MPGRTKPATPPAAETQPEPAQLALRADLHVHSLASDGTSSVQEILAAAESSGLDLIAIADHERIDAALAAREIALSSGLRLDVVVAEEVSTRSGHLLGLFMRERIGPWHSMRDSVARIHDQGGLAIVAHPLVPYPLCASEGTIRRLFEDADPIFHPDGIEAFNPTTARMPWSRRVPGLVAELGVAATGGSDAHRAALIGRALTIIPARRGQSPSEALRTAVAERSTTWEGEAYAWREQLATFRRQLAKNARAVRDEVSGVTRRERTGRDLGYPGGRRRPARLDRAAAGLVEHGEPDGGS